jgi:hypothetical protein
VNELELSLRRALQDDRRALPAWPDPQGRLRARSRAQRRRRAAAFSVVVAAVAAAVAVPVTVDGHGGSGVARLTAVSPSPTVTPTTTREALPGPGKAFPLSVYPQPVAAASGLQQNVVSKCPNAEGLQAVTSVSRSEVTAELTLLARGTSSPLDAELPGVDRAEWTQFAADRAAGGPAGTVSVLYAAPLLEYGGDTYGPPTLAQTISQACGADTSEHSLVAVEGPPGSPALQEEVLFVRRGGRLLAYLMYP